MRNLFTLIYKLCLSIALTLLAVTLGYSQQIVTGQVTDQTSGDPLPGVSILLKGTSDGTITDVSGNYTINTQSPSDVLIFSFVGYASEEITVGQKSTINVSMTESITALNEIVVLGYSSTDKESVSGAVALVPIKDALKLPVTNASEAFQGRIAGVTVVADGEPGKAPLVRIRGYGTPNNNNPLYVIDGMQTTDPNILNDIAPGDIESISVLKDASVSSIYGARAANGVVVVTTKKGKATGKPTLTFDTFYGTQSAVNLPELLNAQQWATTIGSGTVPAFVGPSNGSQTYNFEDINTRTTPVSPGGTNWYDEIFNPATVQSYYLSASGGSENGRYMMSAGYMDKEGVLLNTGFKRYTARINSEFNMTDKLRLGQHLNVSLGRRNPVPRVDNDDNPIALAYRMNPLIPVRDAGGNFAGTAVDASNLGNAANPVAALERAKTAGDLNRAFRVFADAYLEYDIIEDLTFKSSLGVNYISELNNSFTAKNPEHGEPVSINSLTETDVLADDWVWNNTINYDKVVSDIHRFNVLLGVEAIRNNRRQKQIRQESFFSEESDFLVMGAGTGQTNVILGSPLSPATFRESNSLFSVFGRVNYSYDSKYLFSATVRNDRTSRFTDGNNSGVFPAFSAGWVLSKESFLESSSAISNLKLRASWGQMGNQALPRPNPTLDILGFDPSLTAYDFGGDGNSSAGLVTTAIGNRNITWETSEQINIGLDVGALNNDLTLSIDYFNINTEGALLNPRPAGVDASTVPAFKNIGDVRNSGIDLNIGYGNFSKTSGIQYDISFNLSMYNNEVTGIDDADVQFFSGGSIRGNTFTRLDIGNPISYFFGREVVGIFQSEDEVNNSPDQGFENATDGVGRFKYRDVNGDNVINDEDRTFLGSPHPDFTFGFNANVAYKGFDVSLFINGSQGNEIYNYTKTFTDFPSVLNGNRSTRVLDSWTAENPNAELPLLSDGVTNNETNPNSYFVEDGSFVRIKNVQIGYSLPDEIINSIGLTKARFYVQGTNLATFTQYEGLDPEIGARPGQSNGNLNLGIDYGRFPLARTFTLGLTIGF